MRLPWLRQTRWACWEPRQVSALTISTRLSRRRSNSLTADRGAARQRLGLQPGRLGEAGYHLGVQGVGLGGDPLGAGELAHSRGAGHAQRHARAGEGERHRALVAPAGLVDRHGALAAKRGQSPGKEAVPRLVVGEGPGGPVQQVHLQGGLGYVDSDVDFFHYRSMLKVHTCIRAALPKAGRPLNCSNSEEAASGGGLGYLRTRGPAGDAAPPPGFFLRRVI